MPKDRAPRIPKDGAIPAEPERMPDDIEYDASKQRLLIGLGFIDNVSAEVWHYEVSGKQVLLQWFSYRKKNRERPIIGDRRPPSKLGEIQPDGWLAEARRYSRPLVIAEGWSDDDIDKIIKEERKAVHTPRK